jgi:hypothetical protein
MNIFEKIILCSLRRKSMKALRQVVKVKNHSFSIILPNDFEADKVEVIILPIDEVPAEKGSVSDLRGKLNLSGEQYNSFHQYINDSRNEWDRSI